MVLQPDGTKAQIDRENDPVERPGAVAVPLKSERPRLLQKRGAPPKAYRLQFQGSSDQSGARRAGIRQAIHKKLQE